MSSASDSQNVPSGKPYAGEAEELISSDSRTESDSPMNIEAISTVYPSGWREGEGDSSAQRGGTPTRNVEEIGPVEKASASGAGNHPSLVDEEESEGEGEEPMGRKGATSKQAKGKKKKEKKTKETPPVLNAVNVTVDGSVCTIKSSMTATKLDAIREKYDIPKEIVLRVPSDNKAVCSYSESPEEVCLFEHMFQWGLRLPSGGEDEWSPAFNFIMRILSHFRYIF